MLGEPGLIEEEVIPELAANVTTSVTTFRPTGGGKWASEPCLV